MLPFYVDLNDNLVSLDLSYNIKKTFPIVLNIYFEFRDYLVFFNKVCNTIRSQTLNNKLKITFFNNFLIPYIQPGILNPNIKIFRTTLQYFVLILTTVKNEHICRTMFHFMFGFDDTKTNYIFKQNQLDIEKLISELNKKQVEQDEINLSPVCKTETNSSKEIRINSLIESKYIEDNIKSDKTTLNNLKVSIKNDMDLINIEKSLKIENPFTEKKQYKTHQLKNTHKHPYHDRDHERNENYFEREPLLNDYNYKDFDNIGVGEKLLSNLINNKEMLNIVIMTMIDIFFEKFSMEMVYKLLLPFAEICFKSYVINIEFNIIFI